MSDLSRSFEDVLILCETLENVTLSVTLRRRIAQAFAFAVEKAFVVGWLKDGDQVDPKAANTSVLRAAERGARERTE